MAMKIETLEKVPPRVAIAAGSAEEPILFINGESGRDNTMLKVRARPGCPWLFGTSTGETAEQVSQTLDQFSTALKPCLEIEIFHDASKMCQISVFRCRSSTSSSIRASCREYNELNQATSSGSSGWKALPRLSLR